MFLNMLAIPRGEQKALSIPGNLANGYLKWWFVKKYLLSNMAGLVCLCMLFFSNLAIHLKPNVAKSVKEIWQAVVRDYLERLGFSFGTANPDVRRFLERRVFFPFLSQLNVYCTLVLFSVSNDHPEVFFGGGIHEFARISSLF